MTLPPLPADLPPVSDDLTFLSPLSPDRAATLVRWLVGELRPGGRVLDAGCGWGELALLVAAAPDVRVVGIDHDADSLTRARRRAADLGIEDRVDFLLGDAATTGPDRVDGLVAIGASQVWGPEVTRGLPLDYEAALTGIRSRVERGSPVVYGEAVWTRSPTPEATAPLSGRADEFVSLAALVDLAVRSGFAPVGVAEATPEEWDDFESGFTARYARWLATHEEDHPDAATVRSRAARQRDAYLRGYRGVLGMAYLRLVAV